MSVSTRAQFIEYCKRRLGAPVLDINVDPDQVEDRVDEALQKYKKYHYDGTTRTFIKHQITQTDVDNEYVPISDSVQYLISLFPVNGTSIGNSGWTGLRYQIAQSDLANMGTFMVDLQYYDQMKQYLSLIDMKLNGQPQIQWSKVQNRLYIFGDFVDQDLKVGDWIVAEAYIVNDPNTYTEIWGSNWLQKYATELIRRQWGENMSKFEGMQLPGGITISGDKMIERADRNIEKLEEDLRMTHELPPDMMVG